MVALRIKQIADASGFTRATLRYYEQIGLLPPPTRTASGYRTYDEHTMERLAFIARAKELGCSLDEISQLKESWDAGVCTTVQDHLANLVTAKIEAVSAQIAELRTFIDKLHHAASGFARQRPSGSCDLCCGCMSARERPSADGGIGVEPAGERPITQIACTLTAAKIPGRISDWQALLQHVYQRERINGGVRCLFEGSVPTDELLRLVTAEQTCCEFFSFAITVDARGLALEVRASDEASSIVASLFGSAS